MHQLCTASPSKNNLGAAASLLAIKDIKARRVMWWRWRFGWAGQDANADGT